MVKFTIDKNKENPYVMLNKTPLSDDRISWRAKGIWAYLLSKPDNWTVREKDLMNKSTEGRDAVRGAIKELVDHGYILKIELREKGKYIGVEYSVFESPIEVEKRPTPTGGEPSPEKPSMVEKTPSAIPLPRKPLTVKPTTANPPHSNTNVTNKPINNKRTTTSKAAIVMPTVVAPILNLPKGIKPSLIKKLTATHGAEPVTKQLKNLIAEQGKRTVKNPAGWLTVAISEEFESRTEVDLFTVQENKELETRLVEKLNTDSNAVSELGDQDFKAMLGQRPWILGMLAGAGG